MIAVEKTREERLKSLQQLCRENGLKVTHQRFEILQAVASAEDHPSAENIFKMVKEKLPTISFDTVYRNLALFEKHGVIARMQYLDDRIRYDPNLHPHPHIVCIRCRKIEDISWPEAESVKTPEKVKGWDSLQTAYIELRGLCKNCSRIQK